MAVHEFLKLCISNAVDRHQKTNHVIFSRNCVSEQEHFTRMFAKRWNIRQHSEQLCFEELKFQQGHKQKNKPF